MYYAHPINPAAMTFGEYEYNHFKDSWTRKHSTLDGALSELGEYVQKCTGKVFADSSDACPELCGVVHGEAICMAVYKVYGMDIVPTLIGIFVA